MLGDNNDARDRAVASASYAKISSFEQLRCYILPVMAPYRIPTANRVDMVADIFTTALTKAIEQGNCSTFRDMINTSRGHGFLHLSLEPFAW